MSGFRRLKPRIQAILASPDWSSRLVELDAMAGRQAVGALFAFLLAKEPELKWRTVVAFGRVMARLAESSMEDARSVLRQMLWRMNEESGSIGWGVPEAMGEIMAVHPGLAREYSHMLLSYIRQYRGRQCDDNFIEHGPLRWGVYWGLARLAEVRPELVRPVVPELLAVLDPALRLEGREGTPEGLECHDGQARGLACLALGRLGVAEARPGLTYALADPSPVEIFRHGRLERTTVAALAAEALQGLPPPSGVVNSA